MLKNLKDLINVFAGYGKTTCIAYRENGKINEKSFQELYEGILDVSNFLVTKGNEKKKIAILCNNDYLTIQFFFGVVYSDNCAVMIDKNESVDEIKKNLKSIGCDTLAYTLEVEDVASSINKVCEGSLEMLQIDNLDFSSNKSFNVDINDEDIAVIMFTSGTTGFRKAVPLTHKNIVSELNSLEDQPLDNLEKCVLSLPLHHAYGLVCSLLYNLFKKNPILINNNFLSLKQDIDDFKPVTLVVAPAMIDFLMKISGGDLNKALGESVYVVISGGGPIPKNIEEAFSESQAVLLNGYGITECSPVVACNSYYDNIPGSVGKVLSCCEVRINENNEILVKGDNVVSNYLNVDEDASFVDGWFNTGDTGRFGDEGELYITGRTKKLIILPNGENVAAEPLEAMIMNIDFVTEVLVHEVDDKIAAEVYCENKNDETYELLKTEIKKINSKLPQTHCITKIILRDTEFDKTALGKIKL